MLSLRSARFLVVLFSSICFFCSHVFIGSLASPVEQTVQKRTSRLTPPAGAIVVSKTPASGQFSTVQSAVNSLPNDGSSKIIFIESGTYAEQVSITRDGPLTIMGETENTATYESNLVTITNSLSATEAGNDDASGTLRVHTTGNFALYNINVKNTFGVGSQALALSSYPSTNAGFYASAFYGSQDTVLAEQGNQYFGFCYIEGAVDYIFGQHARAFFQKNTLASNAPGTITADGPASKTDGLFVINESTIQASTSATSSLTAEVFLGRPWTEFATVAFTSCSLSAIINPAGWEIWSTSEPNTQDVTFAEYENTGAGAAGTRASFATKLTSNAAYNVGVVLGANWATWVDQSYV